MLQRETAFERRALRNYLLQTLLAAAGREDELFSHDTAVSDPDYVFYDNARRIQGREAITAFHREQAKRGAAVCVPVDQRVAMGAWGFAGEQTMHHYLSDGKLQRVKSALVWRCDEAGRMKSLHFYPAASHEDVQLASALDPAALAAELAPLISRIQKFQ
ncbi:MAG: hypothetical protein Q8N17_03530 [Burkholderiaceae bacterium]|nr:hypothetical protein [Burkholderiaceae bacterium]